MNEEQVDSSLKLPQTLPITADDDIAWDYLSTSPSMLKLYLKVLKPRPGLKEGHFVSKFGVESTMSISKTWLDSYIQICGWSTSDTLTVPITAPQVLAIPLHMYLLTHSLFPSSALGMVHAENEMISHRPIDPDLELKVRSWIGNTQWKTRGFQVDVYTTVSQNDEDKPRWQAKTSLFRSAKTSASSKTNKVDQILESPDQTLNLPANQGRLYALIAGDFNPIHLYPITARLFGFKRPIVHGMWTLAHLLNQSYSELNQLSCGRLAVRFRRPLALPLESSWRSQKIDNMTLLQALDSRGKLAVDIAFEALSDDE